MQRHPVYGLVLVGLLVIWSGCATLSKDECLRGNWYNIGFTDGTRGHTQARFAQHLDACKEYQVIPQREEYLQGRKVGLEHYCTPENGYNVGQAGADYAGVCPPERETHFMRAYLQGYVVYAGDKASSIRSNLASEVRRLYDHVKELERHCRAEPDPARRRQLERDIDGFSDRQRRLEWTVQEQLSSLPLAHWSVQESALPADELRRLRSAMHRLDDEESRLRSDMDRLRHEISNVQERWKKEPKKK